MVRIDYKSNEIEFEDFGFIYNTAKGQIPLIPRIGDTVFLKHDGSLSGIVRSVIYKMFNEQGKYKGSIDIEIWLSS